MRFGLAGWGVLIALLATGCVELPSDGTPERVEMSPGAAADDLQVRVFPVAPYKGESPDQLLTGFLAAANADEADYSTAKQYLATGTNWKPDAGVAVLAGTLHRAGVAPKADETYAEVTVSGDKAAELDDRHAYRVAAGESFQEKFGFVKETEGPDKGEWRINRLPDGLIVDPTTFKNNYRPVHRYFFASTDPSAGAAPANPVLVPDPIYLRRRIDPLTAAARSLTDGPPAWLAPAVYSEFDGVRITDRVSIGDGGVATVKVEGPDLYGHPQLCQQMAEQLYQTLADQQGKNQISRLDLSSPNGGCSLNSTQASATVPGLLAGSEATQPYYQLDTGKLMQVPMLGDSLGRPVPGPLGQPNGPTPQKLTQIQVRRDGGAAAAIGADGKSLYLTSLNDGDRLGDPVLTSAADQGLASPSWDGHGDLWVVDRDPHAPRVLMVRSRKAMPVTVDDLGAGTVEGLRISSDGVRAALVVRGPSGGNTVMLGVVVHGGNSDSPTARITNLRRIAPQLVDVASISWADTDQLLVLGKEKDKLQQLHYLGTDGSQSSDSPLQGGESMTAVSATEGRQGADQLPPVLAVSVDHRIYRLQGNQWRELTGVGNALSFAYPG